MPPPHSNTVLVLRTLSIEKLDGVLATCRQRWPTAALAVLSTAARRAELLADPRISEVIELPPGSSGFPRRLRLARSFAAVVIPLGNHRGGGYANVLAAAAGCQAQEYWTSPYGNELRSTSRLSLCRRAALEEVLLALAWPAAWLTARFLRP